VYLSNLIIGDKVPSTKNAITLAIMIATENSLKPGIINPGTNIIQVPMNKPAALFSINFRTIFREEKMDENKYFPILTDARMTHEYTTISKR
jgi:hypothetical protein